MSSGRLPLVVYKNDINKLDLRRLNQTEINVFFALMSTLKNKGVNRVTISFDRFRQISKLDKNINDNEINGLVVGTLDKVGLGALVLENNEKWMMFGIFERVEIDKKTRQISYILNQTFYTYFNKFIDQYTIFPILDFTRIKGKYAKLLYRVLMQYASTGKYHENYDKFISDVLQIPETTNRNNINYKYIAPNVERIKEAIPGFKDLQVTYTRNKKKIVSLEFTWTPFTVKEAANDTNDDFDEEFMKELAEEEKKYNTKNVDDDDLPF